MAQRLSPKRALAWAAIACISAPWIAFHTATPANAGEPPAAAPAVDPASTAALARATAYLRSLPSFKVHADTSRERVVNGDYKLQKLETIDLVLRRPNQMRADIVGDERDQVIVDNGVSLIIYSRPENLYATMSALPTVRETVEVAAARYGIETPIADLVHAAAGEDLGKLAIASRYIGPSEVNGVLCEHHAFRGPEMDWQLWIEMGQSPLLRRIVMTTRNMPGAPQYTAVLTWNTSPALGNETFAFTPPPDAQQMALPKPAAAPQK